ncbi:DNA polymerase III subunit gamma and tau [Brachybacterium muris]|uniref:DNA polymerase III subunit gamma and tau n=1 Tax=Brachybacterium muris TaxID=219301 RepID=UPI00223BF9BC|nr:DNA polymerase III subunit gamma and tau [Brachybacterium muris]
MATALYRRYRPESFAEVIGQDHVTTPLRRALNAGRIGHAYLFSGPRGCGKTTSARILARCLNCAQGPTDTPCGECDSCRDLARDGAGSLDVVEIDAASHGGVDDARELRERASFAPVRDRFKVFIIDEAHMVTSAGFNALLKLVEEPPEHVKFVFATTEPDKVIGTIRSRTHHYPFRLIPPQVLGPYLREVCDAESVAVGDGVLPLVVRAGGGSARDSMSVLDQLMAGAGDDGLDFPTAIALLGFTDTALLDRAVEAISQRDAGTLYGVVEEVISTGHEPRRFVEDLLERIRDLIVLAAVPDRGGDLLPHIPADDLERMHAQASTFQPVDLSTAGELVHETLSTMSGATSPRVHLELLAARLVLRDQMGAGAAAGQAGVQPEPQAGSAGGSGRDEARRIAQERADAARQARGVRAPVQPPAQQSQPPASAQQQKSLPAVQQSQPPAQELQPQPQQPAATSAPSTQAPDGAPAQEQPPAQLSPIPEQPPSQPSGGGGGGGLDPDEVRGHWSAIMDELAQIRRPSWALLAQNSHVHGAEGSTLILGFRTEGLLSAFRRGTAAQNLAEAVQRIMRVQVTVDAVVGEDPGPGGGSGGSSGGSGGPGGGSGGPGSGSGGSAGPRGGSDRGAPRPQGSDSGSAHTAAASDAEDAPPASPPGSARDRAAQSWGDVAVATLGGSARKAPEQERPAQTAPPQHEATPQQESRPESVPRPEGRASRTSAAPADYPPEPDDPYPPEPEDHFPPDPEDSSWRGNGPTAAPARPQREVPSPQPRQDDAVPAPSTSTAPAFAPASAPAADDGDIPVVEDEGRDSLPEGEPRTYGQAALRRALAEGRVVRSRPATGAGAPTGSTPTDTPASSDPGSSASSPDPRGSLGSAGQAAPSSTAAAPVPVRESASAPQQSGVPSADRSVQGADSSQDADGQQRPRSGADLAREAALASRNANRKFGVVRNGPAGETGPDPADDDPTGGATRDDEDAEYTRRTGREVIETVLGGKVLEVIEERPEY